MGSITPFVQAELGRVRLEIDWSDVPQAPSCFVYRVVAGVATLIREGAPAALSNGRACIYDVEAPLDTPVIYRTSVALNTNGSFENDVEAGATTNGLTAGAASVTRSTDYYAAGTGNASLKAVPDGVTATVTVGSEFIPATVGTSYTVTGKLMLPSSWPNGVGITINWYTAGNAFISTSGTANNLWPAPGVFEDYSITATAPATTAKMRVAILEAGTPSAGLPLYADEVYVTSAATTVEAAPVVVLSGGSGWWKDPLHPATMVRLIVDLTCGPCVGPDAVGYLGVGDKTRRADSTVVEVPNNAQGVGVFNKRKSRSSEVRVLASSFAAADRLTALHSSGAPILLQVPSAYGEPDVYGLYGDLVMGRMATDQRVPFQVVGAPFTHVRAPVGPAEGVLGARYADLTRYATYSAANAAGVTWFDGLQGELTT